MAELDERIEKLVASPHPSSWPASASAPTPLLPSWSVPATTPSACTQKPPGPTSAEWRPSRPRRARASGYRLDRGGDRQANSALWRIVMVRIAHDPETTAYFERKVKEGRSKRDVIDSSSATSPASSTATCLAAEPSDRGSGSPHNCRPPGLTFRRLAGPRSGTTICERVA